MIFSPETYLWFKSFHIIGVVVWFAGLFYLVRLFIYHVEVQTEIEEIRDEINNHPVMLGWMFDWDVDIHPEFRT